MKRRKTGSRYNTLCVSQMFRKICFKSRELGSDPIEIPDTRLLTIKTLSSSIICGLKIPSLCLTKTQRPGEQVFQEVHQTIIAKYKRPKAKLCCRHCTTHRTWIVCSSLPWIPELAHSVPPLYFTLHWTFLYQAISTSRHYLHLG